ncbi:TfoX/Sxy family protein [Mycobacterium sp. M1]|uniref:TfoX/Sxy family protein n=1 Tax=Mycolicibacter acidiphilus TaxID=2835306 RepID=A0ABS5RL68_9MYCO|nr:TfoX/Sxy family protein [Mycolicibacter acidiphilus]MBS9534971.1 TfoX/Sxy family protein [Mycolicibacter acidiphilus]
MAYDSYLADRIREQLANTSAVDEQAMFGGLAFLVAGRIAVAASREGGLMVRVDPARAERLLADGAAEPMQMGGRTMRGWLHVGGEQLRTTRQLAKWITIGTAAAEVAPARRQRTTRSIASRSRRVS